MTALSSLWQTSYNSDDSWLPFFLPLSLWLSCWIYCARIKFKYALWHQLHLCHHIGAVTQSLLSLYFNDNSIFNERIPILWSIPFFMVDLFDCVWEKHITYGFHAFFSLILGLYNYNTPLYRTLRMNSKAGLVEISSLLLQKVKDKKDPTLFAIWALIYTLCRIVWIPFIIKELHDNQVPWHAFEMVMIMSFYGLNWFWYAKILNILYKGATAVKDKKSDDGKKDD